MTTEAQISDVKTSESIAKIAPAFVKAQASVKPALKDAKNPHFGSTYADLASAFAACREALAENGIAVLQAPSADGRRVSVCTMLLHDSGEWMRSTLTLTAVKEDPQAVGSAITYARRYGLMGMVGLAAEDDDGNAASAPRTPPQGKGRDNRDNKPGNFRDEYTPTRPASPSAVAKDAIRKATTEDRIKRLVNAARTSEDPDIRDHLGEIEGAAAERLAALAPKEQAP